jgi:GAF domain-containing protein
VHKLLLRQLEDFQISPDKIPEEWNNFLQAIDIAYRQSDEDLKQLKVSLDTALGELNQRFEQQEGQEQAIESRAEQIELWKNQIEIIENIAKSFVDRQDIDELFSVVVAQTQAYFNHDHVAIFLKDDLEEFVILRSVSSGAGIALLDQAYRERIGQNSVISQVAEKGEICIIPDAMEAITLSAPHLLPDTRSAVALPLEIDEQVLGVLDIQDNELNAFQEIELGGLQILSTLIAIAIKNLRSVTELQSSMQEFSTLHQRFSQEQWTPTTQRPDVLGYQYDRLNVSPYWQKLPRNAIEQLQSGQMITQTTNGGDGENSLPKSTLLAPIILRNQLIGVLGFDNEDPKHVWTTDELTMIEAVANQAVLAMDNIRLIEETQRTANRERLITDVTTQMRETLDIETILKTAIKQLGDRLQISQVEVRMGSG